MGLQIDWYIFSFSTSISLFEYTHTYRKNYARNVCGLEN